MQRILVLQPWGIGDMLMAEPMLAALQRCAPRSSVTVLAGSAAAAALIEGSRRCSRVDVFNRRRPTLLEALSHIRRYRKENYDLAILCSRLNAKWAILLRVLAGIPAIAGDGVEPRPRGYTHWRPFDPGMHRVEANMTILRGVWPDAGEARRPVIELDEGIRTEAQRCAMGFGFGSSPVVALHLGSSSGEGIDKRIPAQVASAVVESILRRDPDVRVLVIVGPEDPLPEGLWTQSERVSVLQGASIRMAAALLSRCALLVAGDTAWGHIASAVGVRVLTLAGPTHVNHTKPLGPQNAILRTRESLPCMPCYETELYGRCPIKQRCMTSLAPEEIVSITMEAVQTPVRMT